MVPAVPPAMAYTLLVATGSILALVGCAAVFLPDRRPVAFAKELVRTDWKYLGVAWLVTAGVNEVAHQFHAPGTFTWVIYEVEGSLVANVQTIANPALTAFFVAIYLIGLPTIVLFTYFKVKAHDEHESRRYALGYLTLVSLAVPFFIFVPVGIPSLYAPAEVRPLAFGVDPVITAGMFATDTMVKALPSLHTGLAALAVLYARKASRRYTVFATGLAATVVFSTFYLGIHWFVDAAFALVLVGVAYVISRRVDPERVLPVPDFFGLRPKVLSPDRETE
ncbi:phosphatase PAP2 family protein [Halococcus salsus]|uniref:phosphatase PAP2 family protein n=1 Tax=Halococcus salsus TaxID=2162894 RepID=UPI00135BE80D|nr:phosphatase PAP2 family protein [Halococcus salsus]